MMRSTAHCFCANPGKLSQVAVSIPGFLLHAVTNLAASYLDRDPLPPFRSAFVQWTWTKASPNSADLQQKHVPCRMDMGAADRSSAQRLEAVSHRTQLTEHRIQLHNRKSAQPLASVLMARRNGRAEGMLRNAADCESSG